MIKIINACLIDFDDTCQKFNNFHSIGICTFKLFIR
jgi:hypothetical protein